MKKNIFVKVLLGLTVLALTSCAATVGFQSWFPSKIDLTGYKNVAIQSTQIANPYGYYRYSSVIPVKYRLDSEITVAPEVTKIASRAAFRTSSILDECSNLMSKAFNTGVYKVLSPQKTDELIKYAQANSFRNSVRSVLLQSGADLLVTSSIDAMDYDEYIVPRIEKQKDGSERVAYYLYQRATLSFSYMLQDVERAVIVANEKTSGCYPLAVTDAFGRPFEQYHVTQIGTSKPDGTDFKTEKHFFVPSADDMFVQIINSFEEQIRKAVSPYQERLYLSLLNDPNKSEIMKTADSLVSKGQYAQALEIYREIYSKQRLFEAGYNMAIVEFVMGNRTSAVDSAYKLWNSSYNEKALSLYEKLSKITEAQNKAIGQITGTEKNVSNTGELIGF